MQYDDPFANEKAVERPPNAGTTARPKLEQAITKRSRVRKPESWSVLGQEFDQARVVREDVHGPRLNLVKHPLVEVLDLEGHNGMLAYMRTQSNAHCPDVQLSGEPLLEFTQAVSVRFPIRLSPLPSCRVTLC